MFYKNDEMMWKLYIEFYTCNWMKYTHASASLILDKLFVDKSICLTHSGTNDLRSDIKSHQWLTLYSSKRARAPL